MSALTRAEILRLIPHGETICLLDEVLGWDETAIHCRSTRFAAADNPLRRADGTLGTAAAIEIAAQAMALHGGLTAPAQAAPRPGALVSLRDVTLHGATLGPPGPLTISATRLHGGAEGASYAFTLATAAGPRLSGRATVLFGAA